MTISTRRMSRRASRRIASGARARPRTCPSTGWARSSAPAASAPCPTTTTTTRPGPWMTSWSSRWRWECREWGFPEGPGHQGVPKVFPWRWEHREWGFPEGPGIAVSPGCPQGVPGLIPPVHPTLNSRCDVVPGSPDVVFPGSRSSRRCTPTAATTSPSSPWIPSPARRAGSPSSSPPETSGELGGKLGILPKKTPGILGIFPQKHPGILIFPGGKIQEFCLKKPRDSDIPQSGNLGIFPQKAPGF